MADPNVPHDPAAGPDANTIVGLLADGDRRRVLAAIELGATTLDEATTVSGLTDHRSSKALGKLSEDPAALRRYLVEETFLDRKDGIYWRAGGTVDLVATNAERLL